MLFEGCDLSLGTRIYDFISILILCDQINLIVVEMEAFDKVLLFAIRWTGSLAISRFLFIY